MKIVPRILGIFDLKFKFIFSHKQFQVSFFISKNSIIRKEGEKI